MYFSKNRAEYAKCMNFGTTIHTVLNALTNRLHCIVVPWKFINTYTNTITPKDLLVVLPEDIDFVEPFVFYYNRSMGPEKKGYVRMYIYYSDLINLP